MLLTMLVFLNMYRNFEKQHNMDNKIIDYLETHSGQTPSKWREEAQYRRDNKLWLSKSQKIAVKILVVMKEEHITQQELAARMECSQQYVSKILRGTENLSLDIITRLEKASGVVLIAE